MYISFSPLSVSIQKIRIEIKNKLPRTSRQLISDFLIVPTPPAKFSGHKPPRLCGKERRFGNPPYARRTYTAVSAFLKLLLIFCAVPFEGYHHGGSNLLQLQSRSALMRRILLLCRLQQLL